MTTQQECAPQHRWQVGIARVDITPPLGVWLAGFGGRVHGATGMVDPLYATVFILADGEKRVAIVSCDLLSLDATDVGHIRALIEHNTGLKPECILIHTTHTHAGPLACSMRGFGTRDAAYEAVLWRKIASAVTLAMQRMAPADLTYGTAQAPVGINRRLARRGQTVIGEEPDGLVDSTAAVLGIWSTDTDQPKLRGVILWAAVHAVMLGGANYLLSRDIPGRAVDRIEAVYPGATCMYLTGPCGNINPRHMTAPDKQAMVKRHGDTLAGAAVMALANAHPLPASGLQVHSLVVDIPLLPLPAEDDIKAMAQNVEKSIVATGDQVEARLAIDYRLRWAEDALASLHGEPRALAQGTHTSVEFQVMVLGDLVITALPFEAFVEYQGMAATSAPGTESLVVAYANGNYGYMFTEEAFYQGGYEVNGAYQLYALQQFAPQAPAAVEKGIRRLHALVTTDTTL